MIKNKNLLYVFGGEKASGAENVILRLIEANVHYINAHILLAPGDFANKLIEEKGHVFENIVINKSLKKLNRSEVDKYRFLFIAFYNYIYNSIIVLRYIRKNKITVVHANTIVPAFYLVPAILYSKLFFSKVGWVWSDHDLKYYARLDHYLSKICVSLYDITFVVSNAVGNKYSNKSKVKLLYNGVLPNEMLLHSKSENALLSEINIPESFIVMGIAASIISRKGVVELIKVFNKLCNSYTNITLLVAGHLSKDEQEYGKVFLNLIKDNNKVFYLGPIREMNKFYNTCDIIVNNSSSIGSEPLGTTIIEAMSYGKIVLASATGGSPEIISDKEDGLLFLPDNFDELYDTLLYCINNMCKIQYLRENAVRKISKKFSIMNMVSLYNFYLSQL